MKKKLAGHDTMHGTDASPFMEPETTTKIAKLLEEEIDFFFPHLPENRILMLLHLKKTKWRTQERKLQNYFFQLCSCFERGCISNLRVSMTSESQNKSRSQITVLTSTLSLNLPLASSIFPTICIPISTLQSRCS